MACSPEWPSISRPLRSVDAVLKHSIHPRLPVHTPDLRTSRVLLGVLLCGAVLLAVGCTTGRGPSDPKRTEILELRVHQLINQERVRRGLPALTRLEALDLEARHHSKAMATGRARFSHRGFDDRAARIRGVAAVSAVGENLSQSRHHADPAAAAVEQWLASRAHRRNLLGDYDLTGVGVARARDGSVFITQLFARRIADS